MHAICTNPAPEIQGRDFSLDKLIEGHFSAFSPQIGTFSRPADRKAHTGR